MLELGADPNAAAKGLAKTALIYAARMDDLAAVQLLLSAAGDPAARTQAQRCYGWSATRGRR